LIAEGGNEVKRMKPKCIMITMLAFLLVLTTAAVSFAQESEPIVRKITITGNKHVSTEFIEKLITNTKIGQPANRDKLTKDLDSIAQSGPIYYVSVDSKVYEDGIELIFEITENPVIDKVQILGLTQLKPEKVRQFITQKEGAVLDSRRLDNDIWLAVRKVEDEYGYIIWPQDLQLQDGVLQITYKEMVYGDIVIEGNEKTKEKVIRRELQMHPGDVIDYERLGQSLGKIMMLGFFEEVEPIFEESDDPSVVNLRIKVTERQTGLASFGAGYSKVDGLVGLIQITDGNFRGSGNKLDVKWEFGKTKSSYDLGLDFPYLGDTPASFGLNAYNRSVTRVIDGVSVDDHRLGGGISLGRRLGLFSQAFMRVKIEDIDVVSEDDALNETNKLRSLAFVAQTDSRNHPFFPSQGWMGYVSAEMAGSFMGGDLNFTTYRGSASKYLQIGQTNKHTVALRLEAGIQTGDVPTYERFYVGGTESVRGYDYGQFKGEKMAVANAEYRLKLTDSIQGIAFVDLGNAWDKEQAVSLKDLKLGYGVGVRIDTPIGVMGLGYGIGEDGGKTYFTIGQSF